MNVYITTGSGQIEDSYVPLLRQLAQQDRFGIHALTQDAAVADIILFVDAHVHPHDLKLGILRRHPLTRRYPEKTFVYNEQDQPWCAMPGLYVSMPKANFNPDRQRACSYILSNFNPYCRASGADAPPPDLLFSFMGRRCHPTRELILQIQHPRAWIENTTQYNFFGGMSGESAAAQQRRYSDILHRSKFILCPRGSGPASFRLFETLSAGRVPVIISDEWVAPIGPDWNACALTIRESKVPDLAAIVEANEPRFEAMAQAARCEWEQWFAPEVLFHRMVEACGDIMQRRRRSEMAWRRQPDSRYLRLYLRGLKARVKR